MVELIEGKSHMVVKRDGTIEPYSKDKLYAVILWASDGSEAFADQLIQAIDIKIHNKIKIEKLYDELINTASNFISDLFPQWETIAKNLLILKLHKELGVKRAKYPDYRDVVHTNISNGFYSEEKLQGVDLEALSAVIDPKSDLLFTFGGLDLFVQKYCNKTATKLLELPQHVYMRVAIEQMRNLGTQAIIDKYLQLSQHLVTEATPKMVNSLRPRAQMFSCCLAKPEDSQESIDGTIAYLGRESKYGGGLSSDLSAIRAKGSQIDGNKGRSGGVVPFAQQFQAGTGSYNQGDTRSSAIAMYYNWFHYQSPEITMLKDESGKDEDRARKMKYSVKWNKTLTDAIRNDEHVYLIDPHKTQDLTYAYGEDWSLKYEQYVKSTNIRKRKYGARDLGMLLAKLKIETGNNYTFFTDNVNIQNIGGGVITQSNLCVEYLPNFEAIHHIRDSLVTVDNEITKDVREYSGDIALCNLASVNLVKFIKLTSDEKYKLLKDLVTSMDNCIDLSFYSNNLGKKHSLEHRNLGIGVSNYANLLASSKCFWDSEEARRITHEVFEELHYYAIKASVELAKERGRFPLFDNTRWAEGLFPHEISILGNSDSDLNYPLLQDWESLRSDLLKYGIRNEYLMAIAPTATSGQCINATPGVDAPRKLKTIQEGTYSIPFVVPNLNENREFYQTTFEIANKDTIELAAIRQKFTCMGQSVSLAYPKPDSAYDVLNDIMYAEELGLKTLYYTYTPNTDDLSDDSCEACEA